LFVCVFICVFVCLFVCLLRTSETGTTLEPSQTTQIVFSGEFKEVHLGQHHS
jgi:hypothetical protein